MAPASGANTTQTPSTPLPVAVPAASPSAGDEDPPLKAAEAPRFGEVVIDGKSELTHPAAQPAPKADEVVWKQIVAKRVKKNLGSYLQQMGDLDRSSLAPAPPHAATTSAGARIEAPVPITATTE
jgi:hypothetical protein